ncbi:LysR family transcriptional regulator, regulator of gene expression of beta-lactamase [Cohaesibacter sp. ES.047]|uniref:LysR family transcriptional regulator n=1 Tax=Cohaesibacter sp. ES.047 TaxID=1798205 RepID=UPI000BB778B9|nr:LysR family transcriptional regulator [Cohaesibacter sp. ES.047]SNY93167.1 LysR family transcriptional regulator, regulator of gene expression of beta-lactamase [Cohaesibacter sp. ES.047]
MDRPDIPLNALRTFEAVARQGSFTNAAIELRVTQAAVSHQIARLEELLGFQLFHRTRGGLSLTSEANLLLPVLTSSLDRIGGMLDRVQGHRFEETLNVGVVTTFAAGWLLERLEEFESLYPEIRIRLFTNNNRVNIAQEGLDAAIRFGDGRWSGLEAKPLMTTPLTPLCAPSVAARLEGDKTRLPDHVLLRSYRADEWPLWFIKTGMVPPLLEGPVFDSSVAMADLAAGGYGIALLPVKMFQSRVAMGNLVRCFEEEIVTGSYWITRLSTKEPNPAYAVFESWLIQATSS